MMMNVMNRTIAMGIKTGVMVEDSNTTNAVPVQTMSFTGATVCRLKIIIGNMLSMTGAAIT